MNALHAAAAHPVVSIAVTVLAYWLALELHRRWKWVPPIVAACIPIVAMLLLLREPYPLYNRGGGIFTWWLGPATVALGFPMHRHGMVLRRSLPRLALIVLAGSIVGMTTAGLTAWLLHAPLPVVMSALPKSVTTPIAMGISERIGGIPSLTAVLVIVTGILGALGARYVFDAMKLRDPAIRGFAIGVASHGIGTARAFQVNEQSGAFAALAMGLNGALTAMLVPSVARWIV